MSIPEIFDRMDSFRRREQGNAKWRIMHDFVMVNVQMRYLALEKGEKAPQPWEYYPELFAEEQKRYEKEQEEEELEAYKERRRAYTQEFNRRRNS